MAEARPWDIENGDHRPNRGSYAFQASLWALSTAQRLYARHVADLAPESAEDLDPSPVLERDRRRAVARIILGVADHAQAGIRSDGRIDRMDNSHRRAREAVIAGVAVFPVPWDADPEGRRAWVRDLSAYVVDLLADAAELTDAGPR